MEILKEIYIKDNRAYKTKKAGSITLNVLEPIQGLQFTVSSMLGQGDDIVIIHPDGFKIPVSRSEINKFLPTVTITNGVINDFVAIVESGTGFALVAELSNEYALLKNKYFEKQSLIKNKYSSKEVNIGDIVSFNRGKNTESGYIYLGEVFTLPFELVRTRQYISRNNFNIDIFNSHFKDVEKRFLFVKMKNNKITDFFLFSSFPQVISCESNINVVDVPEILNKIEICFQELVVGFSRPGTERFYIAKDLSYRYYNNAFISVKEHTYSFVIKQTKFTKEEGIELTRNCFGEAIR